MIRITMLLLSVLCVWGRRSSTSEAMGVIFTGRLACAYLPRRLLFQAPESPIHPVYSGVIVRRSRGCGRVCAKGRRGRSGRMRLCDTSDTDVFLFASQNVQCGFVGGERGGGGEDEERSGGKTRRCHECGSP